MARENIHIPPGKLWKITMDRKNAPLGNWTYGSKVTIKPGMKLIFVAGTVPMDENGEIIGKGDFKAQYRKCIENLQVVLEAEGATLKDVVQLNNFVRDEDEGMRTGAWRVENWPDLFGKKVGDQTGVGGVFVEVVRICEPYQLVELQAIAAVDPPEEK